MYSADVIKAGAEFFGMDEMKVCPVDWRIDGYVVQSTGLK